MRVIQEFERGEFGIHDSISLETSIHCYPGSVKMLKKILLTAFQDALSDAVSETLNDGKRSEYNIGWLHNDIDTNLYMRLYRFFAYGRYAELRLGELEKARDTLRSFMGASL